MNSTRTNGKAKTADLPWNETAEESLIGAALLSANALEIMVAETDPSDFHRPVHQAIAAAMVRLWNAGIDKVDPVLVYEELESMGEAKTYEIMLADLLDLQGNTPAISNAARYARIVVEHAALRRLIGAGSEISAMGYDPPGGDVAQALDAARLLVGSVELPIGIGEPSPNVETFMDTPEHYDWLVPGLLERGDRILLTGGEGGGKSTLLRQMGMQMAAGIHPWTLEPIVPVSTLLVDVENSGNQIRRKLHGLLAQAHATARDRFDPDRFRIEVHNEGLDLTQRHDARWLMERVASSRPDVLIIGPIYKLHNDDPNDEKPARKVAKVFDMIRTRYGCALLIETHSPHASAGARRPLRPFGASLWMRWPEFGYGIRQDKEDPLAWWFEAWRGARDARDWPRMVRRGGEWPWTDYTDAGYEDRTQDEEAF